MLILCLWQLPCPWYTERRNRVTRGVQAIKREPGSLWLTFHTVWLPLLTALTPFQLDQTESMSAEVSQWLPGLPKGVTEVSIQNGNRKPTRWHYCTMTVMPSSIYVKKSSDSVSNQSQWSLLPFPPRESNSWLQLSLLGGSTIHKMVIFCMLRSLDPSYLWHW